MTHRSTRTAPLPVTEPSPPAIVVPQELAVVSHDVGYTEVVLANGDRVRCHLFVDRFKFDGSSFAPEFRVVPELQLREIAGDKIVAVLQECWQC